MAFAGILPILSTIGGGIAGLLSTTTIGKSLENAASTVIESGAAGIKRKIEGEPLKDEKECSCPKEQKVVLERAERRRFEEPDDYPYDPIPRRRAEKIIAMQHGFVEKSGKSKNRSYDKVSKKVQQRLIDVNPLDSRRRY